MLCTFSTKMEIKTCCNCAPFTGTAYKCKVVQDGSSFRTHLHMFSCLSISKSHVLTGTKLCRNPSRAMRRSGAEGDGKRQKQRKKRQVARRRLRATRRSLVRYFFMLITQGLPSAIRLLPQLYLSILLFVCLNVAKRILKRLVLFSFPIITSNAICR